MLEDESGRIRLVGDVLKGKNLVTGIIIGALGAETPEGDFEVVDICFTGLAPQAYPQEEGAEEEDMDVDGAHPPLHCSELWSANDNWTFIGRWLIRFFRGRVDWRSFWIGNRVNDPKRRATTDADRVSDW